MTEKCFIGYVHAITSYGHSFGQRFDRLEPCCDRFERWFYNTGHSKIRNFSQCQPEERSGINLVTRGVFSLVLRLSDPLTEDNLKFCPFCGAQIELSCTKNVELKRRTKEIPDGYTEIVKWEK